VSTSDEDIRLGHLAAEGRARQSRVPASAPPAEDSRTHEDELRVAHEGRPTLSDQRKQEWRVYP
jgi:hypothetical protein